MKVIQISPGRFHHFHLARQMERFDLLKAIYTGYPRFKLKDEKGIPLEKIKTYPFFQTLYMSRSKIGLTNNNWLNAALQWQVCQTLDKYTANSINEIGVLIALSCNGLQAGKKMKSIGGKYICDRGSSHIVYQNDILSEEYDKWGFKWRGIDSRLIDKELKEYEESDIITIPSEFVKQSFIKNGIPKSKLRKIPYGARLERFRKITDPSKDKFQVLWVGGVSLRKGFMYALEAFQKLKHPNKKFVVIGEMTDEIKQLLEKQDLENIVFKGSIPNSELLHYYGASDVFVLSSLEEGLAMVQGEAMACGCPVIASVNTGSEDLITHGKEGFIVPIRDVESIKNSFEMILDKTHLREEMSENAINKVKSFGGWDLYGNRFKELIDSFNLGL